MVDMRVLEGSSAKFDGLGTRANQLNVLASVSTVRRSRANLVPTLFRVEPLMRTSLVAL